MDTLLLFFLCFILTPFLHNIYFLTYFIRYLLYSMVFLCFGDLGAWIKDFSKLGSHALLQSPSVSRNLRLIFLKWFKYYKTLLISNYLYFFLLIVDMHLFWEVRSFILAKMTLSIWAFWSSKVFHTMLVIMLMAAILRFEWFIEVLYFFHYWSLWLTEHH